MKMNHLGYLIYWAIVGLANVSLYAMEEELLDAEKRRALTWDDVSIIDGRHFYNENVTTKKRISIGKTIKNLRKSYNYKERTITKEIEYPYILDEGLLFGLHELDYGVLKFILPDWMDYVSRKDRSVDRLVGLDNDSELLPDDNVENIIKMAHFIYAAHLNGSEQKLTNRLDIDDALYNYVDSELRYLHQKKIGVRISEDGFHTFSITRCSSCLDREECLEECPNCYVEEKFHCQYCEYLLRHLMLIRRYHNSGF